MTPVNALITYYSTTGTHQTAARLARVAERAGAEVRVRDVAEFTPGDVVEHGGAWTDLAWADVVLWGAPSRHGNVASQLMHIFERLGPPWVTRRLSEKVYAGFTASQLGADGLQHEELKVFERMAERCVALARRHKAARAVA